MERKLQDSQDRVRDYEARISEQTKLIAEMTLKVRASINCVAIRTYRTYIHTYTHSIHTFTCIYVHMYTHTYIRMCMHTCIHTLVCSICKCMHCSNTIEVFGRLYPPEPVQSEHYSETLEELREKIRGVTAENSFLQTKIDATEK